jgi:hypothetical protein
MAIRLESQIILKSLGAIKPKGIKRISKIVVPQNLHQFWVAMVYTR